MGKRLSMAVLTAMMAAGTLLAGCGQGIEEPVVEPPVIERPVVTVVEPQIEEEPPKPFRHALTGIGADERIDDRPIVVMVENSPASRPQDGLHKADIVYEILAEGDITRFVAVYQSEQAEVIGPVRSARPYFVELASGLDALYVHAGWSQEAMNTIKRLKVANFDQVYGDDAYYWRDSSRKAPHNLYTSTEKIREGAEKKKYREEWNMAAPAFYEEKQLPALTGEPAKEVVIPYIGKYNVSYTYDAEQQRYSRSMAGQPHKDKTSEEQLTAANILIVYSKHKVLDNVGRRSVDVDGPGAGQLVQQGVVREVTWQRVDGVIRALIDGREAELLPGKTWVHIIPESSKPTFE